MRILHYGLGYPPERSGGLVKYVTDLMVEQVKQNHEVAYLFPGKINIFNSSTKIKKERIRITGVTSFELINSLPLAVFGGIRDPEQFRKKVDPSVYSSLLDDFRPDIIHVHSLMGLHKEFFEVATDKKIKIIYTSHDYFGLSPNPTFYFNGKSWDEENSLNFWLNVSEGAMSVRKLRMLQLPFYDKARDFIKKFKKNSFQNDKHYILKENKDFSKKFLESFKGLRNYYQEIFDLINYFHFNSSISQQVFLQNILNPIKGEVINITNSTISGGNKVIELNLNEIEKITYIGQYADFKGFYDFLEIASQIKDKTFEIYGESIDVEVPKNVINKGRFYAEDISKVFQDAELIVIPSKCKETYGFLVPESLDFKVPVIVSSNVGAKDLIPKRAILDSKCFVKNFISLLGSGEKIIFESGLVTIHELCLKIDLVYKFVIKEENGVI